MPTRFSTLVFEKSYPKTNKPLGSIERILEMAHELVADHITSKYSTEMFFFFSPDLQNVQI